MESCKINVLKNLITQGQLKTRFLEIELFSTAVHFVMVRSNQETIC
jgi:hypothetical protein